MLYEEMTASSMLKIDLEGNVLFNATEYGVNEAGFVIHSAVHAARHDVDCIIHMHTLAGMAVSAMKCGIMPIAQSSMRFLDIAYHDYEGVALRLEERERLVQNLGNREAMVLRNHGLLTTGATIAECFNNMYRLERACQLQVMALSCNTELQMPPQEVTQYTNNLMLPGVRRRFGLLEWPAMLRKLERTLHDGAGGRYESFRLFLRPEHLAMELFERGLVVECVHWTGPSGHEKLDNPLHFRWMMRNA
jgi:ribulose-5-phosphate 4-epimerase/fuculose-1-phosphate aldolase